MDIRQFRLVLRAKNFDRTCLFYEQVLGLPRLEEWSRDDGRGVLLQAGEAVLEVLGRPAGRSGHGRDEDFDYQAPQHKLTLAVVVPSAEKAYEELLLRDKNIPGGLHRDPDGTLVFRTHDPDGVTVAFREAAELAPERQRELGRRSSAGPEQEHGGTLGEVEWADRGRG
jgi:catechol 2,3-dioxygenase-like lactoylglutathione lyase family enzyme